MILQQPDLLLLDEQGLDISSPWRISGGELIVSVLWPKLYAAWLSKEQWAGCREVDEEVRKLWEQAQLCLAACASLGNAEPAILLTSQLRGTQTQWLRLDELANRHCRLSPVEYAALTSWLSLLETQQLEKSAAASGPSEIPEDWSAFSDILPQQCHSTARNATMQTDLPQLECETSVGIKRQERLRCPPCIRGLISGIQPHEQLVLRCIPQDGLPEVDISATTDQQLAEYLCQHRAVFPCPRSEEDIVSVECLVPLRAVVHPYLYSQEYVVVCRFGDDSAPLAVMHIALIRDCLRGANRERLHAACDRPSWTVASDEFYAGYCFTSVGEHSPAPTWSLRMGHSTTQLELTGLVQYIMHRRRWGSPRIEPTPHPWQTEPPLPVNVTIDISHHHPRNLSAPVGWEVIQRNGRIWIVEQNNQVTKIDAAQYHMLLAMYVTPAANLIATAQFLTSISGSCRAQKAADLEYHVPWSRHLLAR